MERLTFDLETDFTVTVIDYETGLNHTIKVNREKEGERERERDIHIYMKVVQDIRLLIF